jgi:hypothetical protein
MQQSRIGHYANRIGPGLVGYRFRGVGCTVTGEWLSVIHPALTCACGCGAPSRSGLVDAGTLRGVAGCVAAQLEGRSVPMSLDDCGSGAAVAVLAEQFGQLAMSLADHADRPLVQQRLVEFAVREIPGAEHASLTQVIGRQPPRTTAQMADQQCAAAGRGWGRPAGCWLNRSGLRRPPNPGDPMNETPCRHGYLRRAN